VPETAISENNPMVLPLGLRPDPKTASWPAAILMTVVGFLGISFFYLNMSPTPMARTSGMISGGWYCFLLFMMLKSGKPGMWRRVFLGSIALFFAPAFIANLIESRGRMAVDPIDLVMGKVPYCHIVSTMTLIPMALTRTIIFPGSLTGFYASIYSMMTLWLSSSLVLGRGWCAYMCFYGGWDDMFSRTSRKTRLSLHGKEKEVRRFSQAMLAFIVLASMATFSAVYCVWFCPFKIITEYEAVTSIGGYIAAIMFIALFLGLVIVLPILTRKRFQCSAFCPMGPLLSFLDRITPFGIAIDTRVCTQCGLCIKACPMLSLDDSIIAGGKGQPYHSCTKCGECIQVCPKRAVRVVFRPAEWIKRKFGIFDFGGNPAATQTSHAAETGSDGISKPSFGFFGKTVITLLRLGRELMEPRLIFTVTAFVLGSALSFSFAIGTLTRIINLLFNGSFTSGY
jgi:ferredoxin-type protein NapH